MCRISCYTVFSMEGKAMMGIDGVKQNQLMYITLDDLVPQDHPLRDIRKSGFHILTVFKPSGRF